MKQQHRPPPYARHTDANKEFRETRSAGKLGLPVIFLLALVAVSYFYLEK